ncbi:DNA ligase D [Metabacillus sp. RGM 3146]|uniref:DNA ligase D n=1 Tax=Metabacillus sp. RGM 3146 TaxID=3401092 RepID=UPI003B99AF6D
MKPMLPTLTHSVPSEGQWLFEVKYDGFRAILSVFKDRMELISRNGKDLSPSFPEIEQWVNQQRKKLDPYLPLTMDGELSFLLSPYQCDFEQIQMRGRLKTKEKIEVLANKSPCHLCVFDLLEIKGDSLVNSPYHERKKYLMNLFAEWNWPLSIHPKSPSLIQYVPASKNPSELMKKIRLSDGEGMVAKRLDSKWQSGTRTKNWLKIKNYKRAYFYIIGYDEKNSYFHAGVKKNGILIPVGSFSHGMSAEEKNALVRIIKENSEEKIGSFYKAKEGICAELQFLSFLGGQLREPSFLQFHFHENEGAGTWEAFQLSLAPLEQEARITHPLKPIWTSPSIHKLQYILYLLEAAPFMLPFLKDRALTVIRFPHGISGELFYQKNVPDYAPDFVATASSDNIEYILCNDLSTLIWLGNQLAIEFHIPFGTADSNGPSEVVFDLDPPSKDYFHLAVKAAREIKKVFDSFGLTAFPKLSGGKGIQIHLPLSEGAFTYNDTRIFTSFIADYLTASFPDLFTIERLKKNRGSKLYVDYIQHAEGKTIICPYSLRGKENAPAAAPLYWEEIESESYPAQFSMLDMQNRLLSGNCPWAEYFHTNQDDIFSKILNMIVKENRKE